MNSFNTDEDTKKLLKKYTNVNVVVHSFCQSRYPRIDKETYLPIAKDVKDNDLVSKLAICVRNVFILGVLVPARSRWANINFQKQNKAAINLNHFLKIILSNDLG